MPIDLCAPDRRLDPDAADWRAPPPCYARPVPFEPSMRRSASVTPTYSPWVSR
jgi:hypothetical protein